MNLQRAQARIHNQPNKLDSSDQLIPRIVLTNESLKDLQFYFNEPFKTHTYNAYLH